MYNQSPVSSKTLRRERWARDAKEIFAHITIAGIIIGAIGAIGLWVIKSLV